MKRSIFWFTVLLCTIYSCKREVDFKIDYEDVDKVELVWVEHHYLNPTQDHYILSDSLTKRFILDFNRVKEIDPPNKTTCFELVLYFRDGRESRYVTNGEMLLNIKTGEYFQFRSRENMITKFWGIPEREFCIKE